MITGPISATDTDGVNGLLDQVRHTRDAQEFLTQVRRANFCSATVRTKLTAFQAHLKAANHDIDVAEEDLYEFLKHFHLLGYDLARKGSVVSSLLQSHIAQFNKDIPDKIWYQILYEVQEFNQCAGTITLETLPDDLVQHFREPKISHIPASLIKEDIAAEISDLQQVIATNWKHHACAQKIAMACLIGGWDEAMHADIEVVTRIVGQDYRDWIADLRETLQVHDCPLAFKNGLWSAKERSKSWTDFGSRIFDNHLDTLKAVALNVLSMDDPSFELPGDERYTAAIHGKVLPHSSALRVGLSETLALLGSRPESLVNCTRGKADGTALLAVRELLEKSDWIRWASLNNLLPLLSEANPDEFLTAVENAIAAAPSPFDSLFEEEETGIFGRNYITGLLWALEGVAWEEIYLTRTAVVLADIASKDPGGNWANRPGNSLTAIFLPWLPHTLASVQKRQAAIKTICAEQPEVGWKLLESLLPRQHSTTSGTHKPKWRKVIPDNWEKGVTNVEYWQQSRFCAQLIVEQAGFDINKLTILAGLYDHLPSPGAEVLRDKLTSKYCVNLPEDSRMLIWSALCKLIAHHRRFPDAEWSLGDESLLPMEDIAKTLAPKTPSLLYKGLFSEADSYLYEGDGDSKKEQKKLFNLRKAAVVHILAEGGLSKLLEFASVVSDSHLIGEILADLGQSEFDSALLPKLLDTGEHSLRRLAGAYAWRRRYMGDWKWFDDLDKTGWSPNQIALLLCALPFELNAWDRAAVLLGENEAAYWKNTNANSYHTDDELEYALRKLLEFGRSTAVIDCLSRELLKEKPINPVLACDALLSLVKSEELDGRIDSYNVTKIINALQENTATEQDRLFQIEWAYLALLDRYSGCSPITLENRLTSDPGFFCELIQLIYLAEGAESVEEPSESTRKIATNAYRLLSRWTVVPGMQVNKEFDPVLFTSWLNSVEGVVKASGHYDIAMVKFGELLVNSPGEVDGLWIHPVIAEALNSRERASLRDGYGTGIRNSRGAYIVDPEAKPERALAAKYRKQADEVENAGYQRLATTLRDVAASYDRVGA